MKTKINKHITIGTWESFENIMAQFYDGNDINDDRTKKILEILNELDDIDREIFLLFAEFGSYRKVAVQTNRSHTYIASLIGRIRCDIIKKLLT